MYSSSFAGWYFSFKPRADCFRKTWIQRIGYDNKEKKHIKLTENDQYLEVGNTYIFSLTYDDRENIYRIVAPETGNTKVKELKEKKIDKEIVGKFQKAARE